MHSTNNASKSPAIQAFGGKTPFIPFNTLELTFFVAGRIPHQPVLATGREYVLLQVSAPTETPPGVTGNKIVLFGLKKAIPV